jgi:hypothetical protein
MSKQRILMIVALCFVLIGTVAAGIPHEPKPNSVVSCSGYAWPMGVRTHTVPPAIDTTECPTGGIEPGTCSPCIESLENQGCEIAGLATEFIPRDFAEQLPQTAATFQLSCARP